jgi:hypothetical protein
MFAFVTPLRLLHDILVVKSAHVSLLDKRGLLSSFRLIAKHACSFLPLALQLFLLRDQQQQRISADQSRHALRPPALARMISVVLLSLLPRVCMHTLQSSDQ